MSEAQSEQEIASLKFVLKERIERRMGHDPSPLMVTMQDDLKFESGTLAGKGSTEW